MTSSECLYAGVSELKEKIDDYRNRCSAPALVISSESFIHVSATDIGVVARRMKEAFSPCKIIITIRDQLDMIRSFYGLHGRFGQYLFLTKDATEAVKLPLTIDDWLTYQFRAYNQNFLSTLHYYEVIKFYKTVFGHDSVGVFLFEEFVKDRHAYLEKFCDFLSVDLDTSIRLTEGRHELPNLRSRELVSYKFLARFFPNRDLPRVNPIRKILTNSPKVTINIDSGWRERITSLYADGNENLVKDYGLPLEEFGYCL
jgi:hypothetical protein